MAAGAARIAVLSYPPDGPITDDDATALESLKLTEAQKSLVTRIIAEACHSAFFKFFCLLDSGSDPTLTRLKHWSGARFVAPRKEGPMLHDDFGSAYYDYLAAQSARANGAT